MEIIKDYLTGKTDQFTCQRIFEYVDDANMREWKAEHKEKYENIICPIKYNLLRHNLHFTFGVCKENNKYNIIELRYPNLHLTPEEIKKFYQVFSYEIQHTAGFDYAKTVDFVLYGRKPLI